MWCGKERTPRDVPAYIALGGESMRGLDFRVLNRAFPGYAVPSDCGRLGARGPGAYEEEG